MPTLEVGRVIRPHGLRGEVVVHLITNRTERLAVGTVLSSSAGELEVERASPHQDRWIVSFAGVRDRDGAEALRDVVLRAEPIVDPDQLWVHELLGAEVLDVAGRHLGVVSAVEANPASDLLVLDGGGLVPLRFVVEHRPGRLVVDVPDGLVE
ncbi:MAG TPA: ribosome maturation factor RimM [Acidimicrobiales bacterium]|nr:ribosome maturation factor RimM [Acidimicrobiales bacterium]